MNIKNLPDFHGREIESFNSHDSFLKINPEEGQRFIFHYEQIQGSLDFVDLFFIVIIDSDGNEISRRDSLNKEVVQIFWK